LKKLMPTDDAEVPDGVESIAFESDTDLFDGHVRLGINVNDLATARFGRGENRIGSHEANAAENAIELYKRLRVFQGVAERIYGQARSLPINLSFELSRGETLAKLSENSLGFGIEASEEVRAASACRRPGGIY
jgi:hypothetical protein